MITLFGATGFTGQQIARSLDESHLPFRLAGRSSAKLAALSSQLPSHPTWVVADARQSSTLSALFQDTQLLINCSGPYTDIGEKIVSQSAVNGVHYLDISNELGFVHRMQSYDRLARHNNSIIMPAVGFEIALADCAADLLASVSNGQVDSADVIYQLPSESSAGTRRSVIRSLATSWLIYKNGEWQGQVPGNHVREFKMQSRTIYGMSIPSAEGVSFPTHFKVKNVNTWLTIHPGQRFFSSILVPYYARFLRSIAGRWILNSTSRKNPSTKPSPFSIQVALTRGAISRSMAISGSDPYGLTARIVAYAAQQILAPGFKGCGFLAPSCALSSQTFLDYAVANWGLSLEKSSSTI